VKKRLLLKFIFHTKQFIKPNNDRQSGICGRRTLIPPAVSKKSYFYFAVVMREVKGTPYIAK
jgi:hypothetical protein